jgi:hypothetical protein
MIQPLQGCEFDREWRTQGSLRQAQATLGWMIERRWR